MFSVPQAEEVDQYPIYNKSPFLSLHLQ
jgi:hypothetical protein